MEGIIMTEIKDRFDPEDTVCECCKWMNIRSDRDFPCSHCIHNLNNV